MLRFLSHSRTAAVPLGGISRNRRARAPYSALRPGFCATSAPTCLASPGSEAGTCGLAQARSRVSGARRGASVGGGAWREQPCAGHAGRCPPAGLARGKRAEEGAEGAAQGAEAPKGISRAEARKHTWHACPWDGGRAVNCGHGQNP